MLEEAELEAWEVEETSAMELAYLVQRVQDPEVHYLFVAV